MIKWWTVVFLILTLFQNVHAAGIIGGSAQVTWRSSSTTTEGEKEKTWGLIQTYNLGLRKDVTSKISYSADVGVNTTETDETKTTRLFPAFRLNLANEYFDANGGYQLNEEGLEIFGMPSDDPRRTSKTWNANLSTKSEKYPRLRFRYDKNRAYDHLLIHETDTLSELYEVTADYSYKFLNFTLKRLEDVDDNFVDDSTQTTTTNEGRVEFSKPFWDNRVTTSGSYRWTEDERELKAGGQDVRFRIERDRSAGLYAPDGGGLPDVGELDNDQNRYGYLIDEEVEPAILPIPADRINIGDAGSIDQNIGAELVSSEAVEEIWIYTHIEYTDNSTTPIGWEVYWANDNNPATIWTEISGATSEYIEAENRFKISFASMSAKFFKVVNTDTASTSFSDLFVTEIRLFGFITQPARTTSTTTTTRENFIFNTGVRPADWLNITYNFSLDETKTDPESTTKRQSAHNINARADKDLRRDLKAWAQYQTRLEYDSESDRKSTDTYSLHFDYFPLDTLRSSLSITHSVPKVQSKSQSRTTTSLLHLIAALHEGVDLSMDGNLDYTEDLVNDTETFTRTLDSDLRLKLTKTLTTELGYTTNWTNTHNNDGTETSGRNSRTRTDLYYRPTRTFYFRWSYLRTRDKEGEDTSGNQLNINWVMTEKLRLNMDYNVSRNSQVTTLYSSDLAWNLSKIFVLRFEYDRSRQEADTITKTQTFIGTLSARF